MFHIHVLFRKLLAMTPMTANRCFISVWHGLSAIGLICFSLSASALAPDNATDMEIKAAAPYCMYAQGFPLNYQNTTPATANAVQYWRSILGPAIAHIHHYCWARMNAARATRSGVSRERRKALREGAIADIRYVVERAPADFVLLPELHMYAGQLHILLSRPDLAERELRRAIELKPDFWPPFLHLATLLVDQKQTSRAREVVSQGLDKSPQAKPLQRLARKLGVNHVTPASQADASSPSAASSPTATTK